MPTKERGVDLSMQCNACCCQAATERQPRAAALDFEFIELQISVPDADADADAANLNRCARPPDQSRVASACSPSRVPSPSISARRVRRRLGWCYWSNGAVGAMGIGAVECGHDPWRVYRARPRPNLTSYLGGGSAARIASGQGTEPQRSREASDMDVWTVN